jgi:hypothetical protein
VRSNTSFERTRARSSAKLKPRQPRRSTQPLDRMMKFRVILVAAALPSWVGAAGNRTLCESSETAYLSCAVGSKLLSVCGSRDLTANSGYLRYMFGAAGKKPELVYPAAQIHPSRAFRRNEPITSAKAGVMALGFDSSGFTYSVFTTHSAFGYNGAGVIVQKANVQVASMSCTAGTLSDERFFSELAKVGIPIGLVRYVGPEE